MAAYGLRVNTADCDFWIDIEDIEILNAALAPLGYEPHRSPAEARSRRQYALEGYDQVDVIVSRTMPIERGPLSLDDA